MNVLVTHILNHLDSQGCNLFFGLYYNFINFKLFAGSLWHIIYYKLKRTVLPSMSSSYIKEVLSLYFYCSFISSLHREFYEFQSIFWQQLWHIIYYNLKKSQYLPLILASYIKEVLSLSFYCSFISSLHREFYKFQSIFWQQLWHIIYYNLKKSQC